MYSTFIVQLFPCSSKINEHFKDDLIIRHQYCCLEKKMWDQKGRKGGKCGWGIVLPRIIFSYNIELFYSRQYYKASMINFYHSFFLLLATLLLSQPLHAQLAPQFEDPEFLRLINNYFGCKTWEDGICIQCSEKFYFNKNGVCCQVKPECKIFNIEQGICEECYEGYEIFDGKCVLRNLEEGRNYGCRRWENNQCIQCSRRWFFNQNNECQKVSDFCRTWEENGNCETCYQGYALVQNQCLIDINQLNVGQLDPFCGLWQDIICLRCAERAFFNNNGKCTPVDDNCRTWDNFQGFCLSCYRGYDLVEGGCIFSERNLRGPTDLGCHLWDWDNQICLECSQRWVMTDTGCAPISDFCATFNDGGACTSCFKGYDLIEGVCILSQVNQRLPSDLGCKTWDWDNQRCLQCSQRYVMVNGVCRQVSDQCQTWTEDNGQCLTCYKGYELQNGRCFASQITAANLDLGCREWDWDNQICLRCSERWVMGPQGCIPVSDFCRTFNDDGQCLTCYKGFKLELGECLFLDTEEGLPSDVGCARWDWDNQICLECSVRWVMVDQRCFPVSDHCATHNAQGRCTSCYKGYGLEDGECLRQEIEGFFDIGCARWDWDNRICLQCSFRWVMREGGCVPVSDDCATFDTSGICTSCFKGYELDDNRNCILSEDNFPIDVGCRQWDWDAQICLACSHRYIMNENGRCIQVSDHCAIFNDAGQCTFCYKGYELQQGECIFSVAFNTRLPFDLGCSQWDWDNQICLKCSQRWVMSSDGCVKVPDQCNTFSEDGRCTSCYLGYALSDGLCRVQNLICRTAGGDGSCLSCYNGYVLYRGGCSPLSQLADIALYYAQCCPEKLQELRREGRI